MPGSVMKDVDYVVNSQNVRIKKCCASCEFKAETNNNNIRLCKLNGKKTKKDWCCRLWQISKAMNALRIGTKK